MWSTAEPVVCAWIADNLGPVGRLDDLSRGLSLLAAFLADAPRRRARRAPLQPPVVITTANTTNMVIEFH